MMLPSDFEPVAWDYAAELLNLKARYEAPYRGPEVIRQLIEGQMDSAHRTMQTLLAERRVDAVRQMGRPRRADLYIFDDPVTPPKTDAHREAVKRTHDEVFGILRRANRSDS